MTLSEMIASAAAFGTFLSAAATFLTVREVSKQRRATFRPEVILETVSFTGLPNARVGSKLLTDWRQGAIHDIEKVSEGSLNGLPIRNVGLGAAIGVEIAWDMQVGKAVANINALSQRLQVPLALHFDRGTLSLTSDEFGRFTSLWRNQQTQRIDYVLPSSYEAEPKYLQLPHVYIALCALQLAIALKDKAGNLELPDAPKLSVTVAFKDVGGLNSRNKFDISLDWGAIVGSGELVSGSIRSARAVSAPILPAPALRMVALWLRELLP